MTADHKSNEHKLEKKTESQTSNSDKAARESQKGKEYLVQKQKSHNAFLKAGGSSGITNEFGKPALKFSKEFVKPSEKTATTKSEKATTHDEKMHADSADKSEKDKIDKPKDNADQKKEDPQGIAGVIDSSKQYWKDSADAGRQEGGLSGHTSALAADLMGKGTDAFKLGSDLYNTAFPDGAIDTARQHWQGAAADGAGEGGISGAAKWAGANAADGLLALSGLGNVEDGANKVIEGLNKSEHSDQLQHDVKWLAVDTGLAALTFLPGTAGLKALAKGESVLLTAKAGTEIAGMAVTESRLAGNVATRMTEAIAETLPKTGEKLTKTHTENFVAKLKEIGADYGIALKEGGVVGESTGTINLIEYSSKAGGPHEVAHVAQQLQTRITALEGYAAQLGKSVDELTKVDRDDAFKTIVKPFEDIAYNHHEMFAGAAHSWGKTSPKYAEILKANVASFEKALTNATVPEANLGVIPRVYGELANYLGRSQASIARNLAPTANIFYYQLKDLI